MSLSMEDDKIQEIAQLAARIKAMQVQLDDANAVRHNHHSTIFLRDGNARRVR
jgi:hypothetical protein